MGLRRFQRCDKQGERSTGLRVFVHQGPKRLSSYQGRVAVDHQHLADGPLKVRQRHGQRMARSQRLLLFHILHTVAQHRADLLAPRCGRHHHPHSVRTSLPDRSQHMTNHCRPRHRVQHLQGTGAHPSALARRHDNGR
jgi:hypothetical protein